MLKIGKTTLFRKVLFQLYLAEPGSAL